MQHIQHRPHPFTHTQPFWDMLIALSCIACLGVMYVDFYGYAGAVAHIGLAMILYGSFVAPKRIKLNTKSIRLEGFPRMTIAVVADFHVGPYKKSHYLHRVVQKVNAYSPDLILMPGDFLEDYDSDLSDLAPLRDLMAPLGVFATIGNHDSGDRSVNKQRYRVTDRSDDVEKFLASIHIKTLRNESVIIKHASKSVAVCGIDDLWMDSSDISRAFAGISSDVPAILMAHNPDVILDKKHKRASLIVSGHTHGGQIRLPLIGSLSPIPNALGRAYDRGIFRLKGDTTLAITSGVGESMVRARLFCPPEILLLSINEE